MVADQPSRRTQTRRIARAGRPGNGVETVFRLLSGLDEAAANGVARELDAIVHAELFEHVGAVALDRLLADHELLGDPLVAIPLRDQLDDFGLARR